MSEWIISGWKTGIKTTGYPKKDDRNTGTTPGMPVDTEYTPDDAEEVVKYCPFKALHHSEGRVEVDHRYCVHCYRCTRGVKKPMGWQNSYEWASMRAGAETLNMPFQHSAHILVIDAGDCGACLNEVKQLANPYYNMHRLGFFITPTPRQADILLVVGAITEHLQEALQKTYEAMPQPKRVIAAGTCAISGSVFKDSFMCSKRLSDLLPVDIEVPGHPPPPFAILHGLLVAAGRKSPFSNTAKGSKS